MKKTIAFTMSLLMLVPIAAACSGEGKTNGGTDSENAEIAETAAETEPEYAYTKLETIDYDGYVFRNVDIAMDSSPELCFYYEEQSGDIVEDAVYERDSRIAEKYNIGFTSLVMDTYGDSYGYLKKTVAAGSDEFDMIMTIGSWAFSSVVGGLCYTADELTNLDYSQDYYAHFINDQVNISGVQTLAFSELCLLPYTYADCVFFNKEIAENYNVGDLYQDVRDNKWTFDRFYETAAAVTTDLNGDGVIDSSDMIGIGSEPFQYYSALWVAAGVKLVQPDSSGELYFSALSDPKFLDVLQYVMSKTFEQDYAYVSDDFNGYNAFNAGHGLYMMTVVSSTNSMRALNFDYGMLPVPKYDESQEQYHSRICDAWIYCVPVTNPDPGRTSMIMEALTCATNDIVWPAYGERAMYYKNLRDEESKDTLEIIRSTLTMDAGEVIWHDIVDPVRNFLSEEKVDITSKLTTVNKIADSLIKDCEQKLEIRAAAKA